MGWARPEASIDTLRAVALALLVHAVAFCLAFFGLLWQGVPRSSAMGVGMDATLVGSPAAVADSSDTDQAAGKAKIRTDPDATAPQRAKPALQPAQATAWPVLPQTPPWQQPWYMLPVGIPGISAQETPIVAPPQPTEAPVDLGFEGASSNQLRGYYAQAIHGVVNANWIPTGVPDGVHCRVTVTQATGGDVTDVAFDDCPFDGAARDTVEQALHRTSLPYEGFEIVFMRQIPIDFCQPEAACRQ
jgi:hypothetical protein